MKKAIASFVFLVAALLLAGAVYVLIMSTDKMMALYLIVGSLLLVLVGAVIYRKGVRGLFSALYDGSPDYEKLR